VRHQDECPNLRPANRLLLGGAVADAFVSRDHNPIVLTGRREPLGVCGILCKAIVVDDDSKSRVAKNARDLVPAKLAVEKESQFFKRLRRG